MAHPQLNWRYAKMVTIDPFPGRRACRRPPHQSPGNIAIFRLLLLIERQRSLVVGEFAEMSRTGSMLAAALLALASMFAMLFAADAQAVTCPTYVPGQAMHAGCWTLFAPAANVPIVRDVTGMATNIALGIDTDRNQGYGFTPVVLYDSATKGTIDCENVSYRTDVVRCTLWMHIKATIIGAPFTNHFGHILVITGPPSCCNSSGFSTGNLLYKGFNYLKGAAPAQVTLDGGNGGLGWYLVMSPGSTAPPVNVLYTDTNTSADSGGNVAFELRGSFPPYFVCKNQPAQTGCPLAG
jgi:hypothetical protein